MILQSFDGLTEKHLICIEIKSKFGENNLHFFEQDTL